MIIYDTVCFKSSLYEFSSTWFVQTLHYFSFTIQLALLRVFNIKLKNFEFDASKIITNAWFSMKNYTWLYSIKEND